MPDIPQGLTTYLDEEFRSLQRRKSKELKVIQRNLEAVEDDMLRNYTELGQFCQITDIAHPNLSQELLWLAACFKVSLDDFSRMNIEIIGHLLENCGRYLLRNPDTSPRMASFLETLGRKKTVQHLGQQERMIIENAVYYVDPPPRPAIQQQWSLRIDFRILV
jgi:regulator of nonsense transcripts 2